MVSCVLTVAAGCTLTDGEPDPWPPSAPEVTVTMDEYDISVDETPIPAGRVVFRVRNVGEEVHRLTVVPLPEDLPPIEEQLHGDERRDVAALAGTIPRSPGDDGIFAADLKAGRRYALLCFEKDAEGTVHARKGLNAEFRAGGPNADPPENGPGA